MDSSSIPDVFEETKDEIASVQNTEAKTITEDDVSTLVENLTLTPCNSIDLMNKDHSKSLMKEDIEDLNLDNADTGIQSVEQNCSSKSDTDNFLKVIQDQPVSETDNNVSVRPFVNQFLICPVCLEYFKNPKLMPCLHSCCCSCLEKMILKKRKKQTQKNDKESEPCVSSQEEATQYAMTAISNEVDKIDNDADKTIDDGQSCANQDVANQDENSILCPVCKQNIEIPPEGVNNLATNYVLTNMIKSEEKLTQKAHCEVCKLREIVEEASGYCIDCKDLLCKSCWHSHSFTRFTLNHKIVPLEEMEANIIIEYEPVAKCESHHDEELKYFCSDCNCLLCRECILLSHQGHSFDLSSKKAESRRRDLKALIYGFNERLASIKKDEKLEYEIQMERISASENMEVEKINEFCQRLVNAIENERLNEVGKLKSMFQMVKTQCNNRYTTFKNIEKSMQDVMPMVQLIEKQACDNELLTMEPTVHHRLVQLTNMQMKTYPVSWYSMPVISPLNAVQIDCQKVDIELSLFKKTPAKQKFEPVTSIPIHSTLAEMIAAGKFKRISHTTPPDKEDPKAPEGLSSGAGYVDATLWPQTIESKINTGMPVKQNLNGIKILDSSNSEWSDTDTTEDKSADQMSTEKKKTKKRGKRGGKKNKIKREVFDTQNLFPKPSAQNKGLKNKSSAGILGNNFPTAQETFFRAPEASHGHGMSSYNNMYQGLSQPYNNAGAFYGPMSWMSSDMYSQNGMPYPYGMQDHITGNPSMPISQGKKKLSSAPQTKNQQQTKEKPKNIAEGGSEDFKGSVINISGAPTRMISLQPKWRLDVKLSSDMHEPHLQGVFCLQQTSIIVSDVRNARVKTFSTKGEFLKSVDIKDVGRAIFTSNILVYNSKNKVTGKKEDGEEIKPMTFDNTNNCYVSWFPKGQILVANKNKIRQYSIDKENNNFIKQKNIGIEGGPVKEIADVRANMQGQKIAVVDSSSKSVVIFDLEGSVLGTYVEEGNPKWKPTSASFDKRSNVFVTDSGGNRLVFINQSGQFIQQWDTSPTINKPMFVTTNQSQPLYITGHGRYVHVYDYAYL